MSTEHASHGTPEVAHLLCSLLNFFKVMLELTGAMSVWSEEGDIVVVVSMVVVSSVMVVRSVVVMV